MFTTAVTITTTKYWKEKNFKETGQNQGKERFVMSMEDLG